MADDILGRLRRLFLSAVKWVWLAAVLVAAAKYLHKHFDAAAGMAAELPPLVLVVSLLCLVGAKLLLAENARIAASLFGAQGSYWFFFRAYNLSQLGKYLPGSIWQFVGRYAIYRTNGFAPGQSRNAMIAETAWALGGAVCAGLLVFTGPLPAVFSGWTDIRPETLIVATVGIISLSVLIVWRYDAVRLKARLFVPPPVIIALQAAAWIMLGTSLWLVLVSATGYSQGWHYAVGLFGFSYAAGFLVPFAPAGIGIREGVLVVGLASTVAFEHAVLAAIFARVLYVLVEIVLIFVSISRK